MHDVLFILPAMTPAATLIPCVHELTPISPSASPSPSPSPTPLILHDGFLSPPPSFPIDGLSTHLAPPSRPPSPLALSLHMIFNLDDDEPAIKTAQSPKAGPNRPASRSENPQRPPPRPHGATQSKFDLEPNPFEQSFSRSSHHSNSSHSDRTTPPRGTDATSIKHNALPPLSSLTSPAAADPSQFPWLAAQSLRTGPLSPAMLTGPKGTNGQQNNGNAARPTTGGQEGGQAEGAFEAPTFRTGFTPGAGTGFTPGYSSLVSGNFASSLPMPSPNTAAFLNMVTNSTPIEGSAGAGENGQNQSNGAANEGAPIHPPSAIPPHLQPHGLAHLQPQAGPGQETITPGTLSALTGVFNDMNRAGPHPPQFYQHDPHAPPGAHSHLPHGVDFAQQSANAASQAANGLFLLSQAHQELSKREEEGRGAPLTGKKAGNVPPTTRGASNAGQKRKSDASTGGKAAPAKRGKKNTPNTEGNSASPNFEDDDSDQESERRDPNKPETEEEKRKNFLERNRQAALKCRQRKKAWLNELQAKVEQLQVENERLQQTIGGLHDEVGRLSSILMQHRECGLAVQAGYGRPIR